MRVIARLDIKGANVVKTIRTEGLRVMGNPTELAKKYYDEGIDEIVYMDIVASLYERNLDFEQLKTVSENIFVPLTVGGGIRSLNDIAMALHAGADKVAINTYAVSHPEFLTEAVERFGAQCIVLSVEAKKRTDGTWEAYTDGGREKTGVDAVEWIAKAIGLGVGEILLTSVDKDGTREGYDLDLVRAVAGSASVPVIAHGGAGGAADVLAAARAGADALSVSSILHYGDTGVAALKQALLTGGLSIRV